MVHPGLRARIQTDCRTRNILTTDRMQKAWVIYSILACLMHAGMLAFRWQARTHEVNGSFGERRNLMDNERAFPFLKVNPREGKPRSRGITEIRGPYYTPMGRRYLEDVLETMGAYVDSLKFAGGSFSLMPRQRLIELIDLCHKYDVKVSTGGFIEYVLTQGPRLRDRYLTECKNVGFDIVEVSSGFITLPADDLVRLVERVQKQGWLQARGGRAVRGRGRHLCRGVGG